MTTETNEYKEQRLANMDELMTMGYKPFGAAVPPAETWNMLANPYEWDSNSNTNNKEPLYYEEPDESLSEPYQPRMGQLYKRQDLKRLFAQSYGVWEWSGNGYVPQDGEGWPPPDCACSDGNGDFDVARENAINDYCGIKPRVENVKIDGVNVPQEADGTYPVTVSETRFVNLIFNTKVDSQQLPLKMIDIDWGDGEKISISGIEMRSHENSEEPHSFYHLYSVYDCGDPAAGCDRHLTIKIKDNWGWDSEESYDECSPACVSRQGLNPANISFVYSWTDGANYAKFMFEGNMVYGYDSIGPGGNLTAVFNIRDFFPGNDVVVDFKNSTTTTNITTHAVAPSNWADIDFSGNASIPNNSSYNPTTSLPSNTPMHDTIWFADADNDIWYLIDWHYPPSPSTPIFAWWDHIANCEWKNSLYSLGYSSTYCAANASSISALGMPNDNLTSSIQDVSHECGKLL